VKQYIYQLVLLLSQALATIVYGQNPDKSFSQLCGEVSVEETRAAKWWQYIVFWYHPIWFFIWRIVLNYLFYELCDEVDHCENAYLTSSEKNTKDILIFVKNNDNKIEFEKLSKLKRLQ
jgi:hypothetical protein